MTPDTTRPPALQTIAECQLQAAGFDWDAIRVPRHIGLRALRILGPCNGAVIEDPREPALYWFLRPGETAGWEVTETRPLGVTQHLVVPPAHRVQGPGPHWHIRPVDGRLITDRDMLRAAVEYAVTTLLGHERQHVGSRSQSEGEEV
ncbi:hypothetical protein [Streptomyces sulphureus]|uniref:hypothetical protein n=1 Tax=Streptomyces sulphureus TaxID=47758 RepID=UPI0003AAD5A6|nr:hypothetical protein [Streptomyces sulphureus]